MTIEPTGTPIPLALGGARPFRCYFCRLPFVPETWHVELPGGDDPVCRRCALENPDLHVWQLQVDIYDQIDRLMQVLPNREARLMHAAFLDGRADHFARWRWPEDEPLDSAE